MLDSEDQEREDRAYRDANYCGTVAEHHREEADLEWSLREDFNGRQRREAVARARAGAEVHDPLDDGEPPANERESSSERS